MKGVMKIINENKYPQIIHLQNSPMLTYKKVSFAKVYMREHCTHELDHRYEDMKC